ncbi:MAG: MFS transporter, partial [Dialister sp.]|nr:MFS transporter [Dialister sp.]
MQNWKRIVYTMAAIQIGTGISIIGVVAFIPLFLTSELGVTDPGEAAFWAGLISGVTPFFVAIAAPFWSMQADRRGPRFALSMILFILGVVIALMYFTRSPVELLILRMIQGMSGGFVAVGMSLVMNVTPKKQLTWAMGVFQASMVMGVMFGPLVGGMIADTLGYRMPFV